MPDAEGVELAATPAAATGPSLSSPRNGRAEVPADLRLDRAVDHDGLIDEAGFRVLEAELVDAGRWPDLATLYEIAVQHAPDGDVGRGMMLHCGLLHMEKLEDPATAEMYFRRILASDPEDFEGLHAYASLALSQSRYAEAADLLDGALAAAPDDDKPDLCVALARIAMEHLDEPDRAIDVLTYAHEIDPSRVDVLQQARAALEAQGQWHAVLPVLDAEAASRFGSAGLPAKPSEASRLMAQAYRRLGEHLIDMPLAHEAAQVCLERARALGDNDALSKLDDLAGYSADWAARAKACETEAMAARDKRVAAQLYVRAAETHLAFGHDRLKSDHVLDRALILCPGLPEALAFLNRAHADDPPALAARLRSVAADVKDVDTKVAILNRVANTYARAGDAAGAIAVYREILEAAPAHRAAAAAVSAALAEEGAHAERAALLERFLEASAETHAKVTVLLELGGLEAEQLGLSDAARGRFEAVLRLRPNAFHAAGALRALYTDAREPQKRLEVLKILVDFSPDVFSRLDLLAELAEVAAQVGPEHAFDAHRRIFELDPNAKDAQATLVDLAAEVGRLDALAQTLSSAASRQPGQRGAELWAAAGQVYDRQLKRPAEAIAAYKRALALHAQDADTRHALEQLLAEGEDPGAVVALLQAELQTDLDAAERAALLAKLGGVLDGELGDLPKAIEVFEQLLELGRADHSALALERLEDLHRRQQAWSEVVAVLAKQEAAAEDPHTAALAKARRARVLHEHQGDRQGAVALYLSVIDELGDDDEAIADLHKLLIEGVRSAEIAAALAPVFERRGQPNQQLEMLRVLLSSEADQEQAGLRSTHALAAGRVAAQRLGDPEAALELFATALDADPTIPEAVSQFTDAADALGVPADAVALLSTLVTRQGLHSEAVARLSCALGQILEVSLERRAEAIDAYTTALGADGTNAAASGALERLLGAEERYEDLASLLQERRDATEDDAAKLHLSLRLAAIRHEHLDDLDGAEEACRAALAIEPGSTAAFNRLIEILELQEAHSELVEALGAMLKATADPAIQAALNVRAGDVLRNQLSEPAEALERYAEALQARPGDRGAVAGLEQLLDDDGTGAAAGALLAPIYAETGAHAERIAAMRRQLDGADDRAALYRAIADVQLEQLNSAEAAFDTLKEAFAEDLLTDEDRAQFVRVALGANRGAALAALLAPKAAGDDAEAELIRELARLYEGPAGDAENATLQYQRLVDRDAADADALAALERLHGAGEDPAALADVLLARVETIEDPAERLAVTKRAAAIYEELVEDLSKAADALERARALAPDDRNTLNELERLYRRTEQPVRVADVLAAEAELLEAPTERAAVLGRLAEAHLALDAPLAAVRAFAGVLELLPSDAAARAGLELLLDGDAGVAAATALEPAYRRTASWPALVDVYERLAEASEDPSQRLERLVAIRSTYEERLQDAPRAFNAAARVYKEAPDDEDVLVALERLAIKGKVVDELVGMLEDRADTFEAGSDDRYRILLRIARFVDGTDDKHQALAAWRNILQEHPRDLAALEAVVRLSSDLGDEDSMVVVLEALAQVQTEPAAKAEHLRAAATILEGSEEGRDRAIDAYEQVRVLAPGDREALVRLDALYTAAQSHQALQGVLTDLIACSEGKDRAVLRLRLGRLEGSILGDPEAAVEALTAVVTSGGEGSEPALEGAVDSLDEIVELNKTDDPQLAAKAAAVIEPYWAEAGNHLKVVEAKEAQAAAIEAPAERRSMLMQIAGTYEDDLQQPQMAFLALTRAYKGAPGDRELGAELERLAALADTKEELADLLADAIPLVEDQSAVLALSRQVAALYDHELGRLDAAVPHYERILGMEPHELEIIEALERIHESLGNARGLISVYRSKLSLPSNDDAAKKKIFADIAQILDSDLHDAGAAIEAYRARIEMDPTDVEAMDAMAEIAAREDEGEALVEALSKRAALAEGETQAGLLVRVGVARRDLLSDPIGAVDEFSAALVASDRHPGAIQHLALLAQNPGPPRAKAAGALAPIYYDSGAFGDYVACVDAQLAVEEESERRKAFLLDIAAVYEDKLGRPQLAFTYACRALHEDLRDGLVRAKVETLAQSNQLFEDLAGFYLDEVDGVTDTALAVDLRRRVADIYDGDLNDVERAIAEHMKVLEVAPGDTDTLHALERLYRLKGSFGELAEIFRRRIAQSEDRAVRAVLMRELARIQADQLDDPSGAIATLRRLLDIEPEDLDALQRLAHLCTEQRRFSELSDVLERLISTAEDGGETQLDAKLALARIKLDELADPDTAHQLLREVLAVDPKHVATRRELQDRLEDALAEDRSRTAIQLASIAAAAMRTEGQWQPLIELLRVRVNLCTEPHDRVPINREVAAIYRDRLAQPELAFAALSQAFRDAPSDLEIRGEMERLADELLMVEDLVEAYESGLEAIADPEARITLMARIAELLETKVGDRQRACQAWERVLARRPMDAEGTAALDRLNVALGRWAALTDILDKRIELAGDDAKTVHELQMRLGAIWQERLGEDAEALRCFRAARQLAPRDPETLRALVRLLDDETDPDELYEVLTLLVEQTDSDRALVRLLPRLAHLTSTRFERASEAIELWERVLAFEPGHTTSLQQLEKLYEREGHWPQLAELLERQLRVARDDAEIIRLQRRLGLIKGTRLDKVDEAVAIWTQILKRNPNDIEALEALRKTYRAAERWNALVSTLRKLVPLQSDALGVKSLRFELAEVFLSNLQRRDEAIESAKRVLDVEPLTVAELMRLEEIFIAAEAFHDAIRVMNMRSERTEDPGQRSDILFAVASLYESKLGRRANAASAYEQILTESPSDTKAYDALAGIYEGGGDFRKLVEIHNRRLETTVDSEERRRLLFDIIDIQERRLGHKDFAFFAACRAFGEEGADPKAQEVAERLAGETESWEELVDVYEEQIEQVPMPRALELRRRLAQLYLDELDEPARAERHLDLVLTVRPEDVESRAEMARLLEGQGRWRDLCNLTLDQIDQTQDVGERVNLFMQIADVEETRLGEPDSAIATLRRAVEVDPTRDEPLEAVARLLRATEQWHPLVDVLERRAGLADTDELVAARKLDLAAVWDECIEDVDRAIAGYREVLALDPANIRALKALEHLYSEAQRWHDLIDVYEQQVLLAPELQLQMDVLGRIAKVKEERFDDAAAASEDFVRILHLDPGHLPTVRELERLWTASGDHERLVEAYSRHIEVVEDADEKVELYLALGEEHAKHLDDPESAEAAFKAALSLDPDNREAVHGLGELYESQSSWFNALEMLKLETNLLGKVPSAVALHFRTGAIQENMLMDRAAAKAAYARAIQVDNSYTPALQALAAIYRDEANWEDVVRLEAQEAKHTEDEARRAQIYCEAADTALDRLDDMDAAIKLYERALDAVFDHLPSARALADLYFVAEEWERAERLLELLVERLDRRESAADVCRQYYRLAYISEKLGDDERALQRYLSSYEVDATYLPTLEGLAGALLRTERWEDAQRIFQTILVHHRDDLTDAEVVDLYFQLGELAVKLDDLDRARRSFDNAIELDAHHPGTLKAYAELCEQLGSWEDAYDHRVHLIEQLRGPALLDELLHQARLCEQTLEDPYRAIDAYAQARQVEPDNADILRSLGRLYRGTGQFLLAVDAYEDLVKVLASKPAKIEVLHELSQIHSDERKEWSPAADALNSALDLDPTSLTAFAKLEALLAKNKRWAALEENYRRMIGRLPKDSGAKQRKVVLWRALGDLHREVFKNRDNALMAYRVAFKLAPDQYDVAQTLAKLLSEKRDTVDEAIKIYTRLVPLVDQPDTPMRALWPLHYALKQRDNTLGAVGALVLMGVAETDELRLYENLLKRGPQAPTQRLNDRLWRDLLFHKNCRNSIRDICSLLVRGAPQLFEGEQLEQRLDKRKERIDLGGKGRGKRAGLRYFSIYRDLANVMDLGDIEHYHRATSAQAPTLYPGQANVLFAGQQHAVFRELPSRQIVWTLARQMTCARPELALARALSPEDVGAALEAAIRLYVREGSGVDLAIAEHKVTGWMRNLQRFMEEKAMRALKAPVLACVERGEMRKLTQFLEGVEHTANRAALLMAGDVRVATRGLAEAATIVDLNPRRRARELMFFLLHQDYFTLRKHLGLAIETSTDRARAGGR